MAVHRKPPIQSGGRAEGAPMPDEFNFSIETTTMRLKSLKLRRAEAAEKAIDYQLRSQNKT